MWVIRDLVITLVLLLGFLASLVALPIIITGIVALMIVIVTYAGIREARIKAQTQEEVEDSDAENNDS